jgi:hypothetical protein
MENHDQLSALLRKQSCSSDEQPTEAGDAACPERSEGTEVDYAATEVNHAASRELDRSTVMDIPSTGAGDAVTLLRN